MPDASRHHYGVSGPELDVNVTVGVFELEAHGTRDEVEEFVAIGMDLSIMGRLTCDQRGPDRDAVDSAWGPPGLPVDEDGPSGFPVDTDDLGAQVDQLPRFDLVGAGHGLLRLPAVVALLVVARCIDRGSRTAAAGSGNIDDMEPSDAEAIVASMADPSAFGVIFDRHAATIGRYLTRRVEPTAAEGLLGDVFRIAFEQRASFDPCRSSARPWLYGIAANLVGRHRRSGRRRLHAMAKLAARQPSGQDDVVGEHAARSIDAAKAWSRLAGAIDALPVVERETLLLFAWEGLAYDDIADAMGVPIGTVRSRLNRARRRLRELDSTPDTPPSQPDPTEADTDGR